VALINYAPANGFQANGYWCQWDSSYNKCFTNVVSYSSGNGFQAVSATTNANAACPSGTFVDFDGRGFKGESYSGIPCTS